MPSPFPGMDPYLEEPGLWPDVHARLIGIASEFLGQALRPKHYEGREIAGTGELRDQAARRHEITQPSGEIDLLRRGEPIPVYSGIPPHEYLVHVSRADRRPKATLWPIRLSQQLPPISVPLKSEDGDAVLDLQPVLDTAWDRAGYDLEIDYANDAIPPLEGEWKTWAHRLLVEKGLRAG